MFMSGGSFLFHIQCSRVEGVFSSTSSLSSSCFMESREEVRRSQFSYLKTHLPTGLPAFFCHLSWVETPLGSLENFTVGLSVCLSLDSWSKGVLFLRINFLHNF